MRTYLRFTFEQLIAFIVVVVVVPNDSGVVEGNSNDIDIVVGGANGDGYRTILIWC